MWPTYGPDTCCPPIDRLTAVSKQAHLIVHGGKPTPNKRVHFLRAVGTAHLWCAHKSPKSLCTCVHTYVLTIEVCKYAFMHACEYVRKDEWMDGDRYTHITNHEYEHRHTAKNNHQPRADGPDRLVSNHNVFHLLFGHTLETLGQLDRADLCVEVGFVLLLRLSNA